MNTSTTQKLLTNLRGAGLTLTVIQGGKLSVSPKSLLTDQIREDIKAAMPELIECLTSANDGLVTRTPTIRPAGLSEKMLAASMALDAQQAGF